MARILSRWLLLRVISDYSASGKRGIRRETVVNLYPFAPDPFALSGYSSADPSGFRLSNRKVESPARNPIMDSLQPK